MNGLARIFIAVLLPLLLVACDRKPMPPLVLGTDAWPGYGPFYLAQEQGYYSGVNVRLTQYGNAAEVKKALLGHELHAAALPLGEALQLRRDIPDLKIVLLLDVSNGADAILAQPGIADVRQLQGKRVGMEGMGQGRYFLHLALQGAGMQDSQVESLVVPAGEMEAALRTHKVDAVVASGAGRVRLLEAGAQSLFDSSRTPNAMFDVLVVRDDDIGQYHGELLQLVQGWQRALDFVRAQPEQYGKAMQGIELLGLQRNRELMAGDKPAAGPMLDAMQRFQLERGLINMGADPGALLDAVLLPEEKH